MEHYTRTAGLRKKVGVWIRVSTDEQAQGDSPKHHELRARHYAESKEWDVVEVYNLSGQSGKAVMEYPETKRMMADVKRGKITGLIFSKLARLARNTKELLTISEFFQEHQADLVSLQEAIDTSTPAGRLFFSVNASLAQFEREEIACRVAASVPIRAKLGKPLGGLAPFGYVWRDKRLVVEPKDALVRKAMYELFAEHKRKKTVARIMNERGYLTRSGGKWSDTTVTRVISDPTAKGVQRQNYTKSLGDGLKWAVKPEHEWVINKVEPIVSEELWEKCNALLEARRTRGERPARRGKSAFTGFVVCYCGQKMYVPFNTPKWVCYKCRNKIPATDLDAVFRDELKSFMVTSERVSAYREEAHSGISEKAEMLASLQAQRDKTKVEADKCFELFQAGALTVVQFKERFQPLDSRKEELQREIPRLEAEIDSLKVVNLSAEHVAAHGRNFYADWPKLPEERKRPIVELLLKSIVIGKEDVSINLLTLPVFELATDRQHIPRGSSRRRA
ncbi:recombinase family protein [Oleiharenicola lentus]|uniref:recombinase family protein n=1 Tax=Oleiharenicola lentus TaxID=2508720 RepID=UPI003F67FAB5